MDHSDQKNGGMGRPIIAPPIKIDAAADAVHHNSSCRAPPPAASYTTDGPTMSLSTAIPCCCASVATVENRCKRSAAKEKHNMCTATIFCKTTTWVPRRDHKRAQGRRRVLNYYGLLVALLLGLIGCADSSNLASDFSSQQQQQYGEEENYYAAKTTTSIRALQTCDGLNFGLCKNNPLCLWDVSTQGCISLPCEERDEEQCDLDIDCLWVAEQCITLPTSSSPNTALPPSPPNPTPPPNNGGGGPPTDVPTYAPTASPPTTNAPSKQPTPKPTLAPTYIGIRQFFC